jgi:hypothetical protein
VLEGRLAANPLAVDVGSIQTAEVAKDEVAVPLLQDAVLFGYDLVEQLNGVVRVSAQAVDGPKLNGLLSLGGGEDDSGHDFRAKGYQLDRAVGDLPFRGPERW